MGKIPKNVKVEIEEGGADAVYQGNDAGDPPPLKHLFAEHKKVYPARVRGAFRSLKWAVMFVLLSIYYVTPWLRFERGEGLPNQAVLLDVNSRTFYFFGLEIWPQEIFLLAALLFLAAIFLFFVTAMFGRIWCGYACPQTVWTDLFLMVERFFEGNRFKQMKMEKAPWTFSKIWRKTAKHITWVLIGLATGGAWVFYFNDAPTLVHDILNAQASFTPVFWMCFLTASTYIMAGKAREHVCTYMCPYARFQGAMFDTDTLVVAYDEARGEPRGKNGEGDCVDCGRCVQVCPTGIDIRNGQQYQCINCGLCVDACNEVMSNVGKELGLIRYNSMNNAIQKQGDFLKSLLSLHLVRPRTIIYFLVILTTIGFMAWHLTIGRMWVEMNVQRERNPIYIQLADGGVRNVYNIRILNKRPHEIQFTLKVNKESAKLSAPLLKQREQSSLNVILEPRGVLSYRLIVDLPRKKAMGKKDLEIKLHSEGYSDTYDTVFIGPQK